MRSLVAILAWGASHLAPLHLGRLTHFDHPSRDKHNKGGFACKVGTRARHATPAARRAFAEGRAIAHRTLPCWTMVTVCSVASMRCLSATVADRGPVNALADLLAPLAAMLGHDGEIGLLLWSHHVAPSNNS